jgi:hypothetical protein
MSDATKEAPECIEILKTLSSLYDSEGFYTTDAQELLNVFNAQQETIKALEDRLQIQRNLTQDWEGKAAELDTRATRAEHQVAAMAKVGEDEGVVGLDSVLVAIVCDVRGGMSTMAVLDKYRAALALAGSPEPTANGGGEVARG